MTNKNSRRRKNYILVIALGSGTVLIGIALVLVILNNMYTAADYCLAANDIECFSEGKYESYIRAALLMSGSGVILALVGLYKLLRKSR